MIQDLMNQPVTIVSQSFSGQIDEYGNDLSDNPTTQLLGYFEERNRAEREGYVPEESSLLVLPAGSGAFIKADDVVVVNNETYTVDGPPAVVWNPTTQSEHHVEATLKRTAGGQEEGS